MDLSILLWILAGAFAATTHSIFKRRRRTPYLKLDLDTLPPVQDGLATLAGLTNASVHLGNAAVVLQDGHLFPAMEHDIRAARHAVHFENFVWTKGQLERRFTELLCQKAREGLKVRVLLDFMGASGADPLQLQKLRDHGVHLRIYARPHWWNLRRMNHRSHRKILVLDGQVAYTFGHGIADAWLGEAHDEHHWRDTGVRLEGPVVHAMQTVFMENWIEESKEIPSGAGCFPPLAPKGNVHAHVVSSACGDALSAVATLYTVAIACAKREVIIQNPYFVPSDGVVELFAKIVQRGVSVSLMVPGTHTDSKVVRRAGCYLYGPLLKAGVRLYEYQPTLLHQKIVIVDEAWSHIGSTNFDARSLALNEEVGVGLLDSAIAHELKQAFLADLAKSREITAAEWNRQPWHARAADWVAYRLQAQL